MRSIRGLDDAVLPRLGAAVRRVTDLLPGGGSAAAPPPPVPVSPSAPTAPSAQTVPTALRRLDDRFATRGPLGLARDVPQLAFLVVALVFFAGTGVVLAESGQDEAPAASSGLSRPALDQPAAVTALGPQVGDPVEGYFARARASLGRLQATDPEEASVALVTLRAPLSPEQALALVAGLQVQRVYLRAAAAERPDLVPVEVTELGTDLAEAYADLARSKQAEADAASEFAQSIDAALLPQDRSAADADVTVLTAEQAAYADRCACVIALVVTSTPGLLAELSAAPGVAAVEPAGPELALADLTVLPLAPEAAVTGTVTALPEPPGIEVAGP